MGSGSGESRRALSPGAAPGSAILIGSALFTDAFVEIFICFCKGSGVVISCGGHDCASAMGWPDSGTSAKSGVPACVLCSVPGMAQTGQA